MNNNNLSNIKKILKNNIFLTIILSFFVFIIVYIISNWFIFIDKNINYKYLNIKSLFTNYNVSKDLVMVHIDEKTTKNLGRYPFSRDIYTKIIKNLNEAWSLLIAFDIILSDKGPSTITDIALSEEIKKSWNIILGWSIYWENKTIFDIPINIFSKNSLWYGFFNPKINNRTNVVYSFYPTLELKTPNSNITKTYNHFSIEILKKYFHIKKDIKINKNWISLMEWIDLPYSSITDKDILINYLPQNRFLNQISLSDIYYKTWKFNNIDFKNKIILIWATAQWLNDTFNTPNWIDFWVYIHANIINTILNWKTLIYFNLILEWILIYLLIITVIYFNLSKNWKYIIISNMLLIIIFILIPILIIFYSSLLLNHPSSLIIAFIFSIITSNLIKYLRENKYKKKMVQALSEYISKDIANKILEESWGIKLEWEKKKISIFFSDISWFTSISEKFDATELVIFLREYLWNMSNIIMDDRWFINKYEWDAIMALYWVFWYENTANYDNCKTALLQQKALNKLNILWKEKYNEILKVRMWLHYWDAIIWNIWAVWRKMEFTALWDNVNLASRLEWVNKYYTTDICVSEAIYNDQKDNFDFRKLDIIRVQWKNNAIIIYELLWFKDTLSDLKKDIIIWFNKALELYFKWDFQIAWKIFKKLWELWDKPSLVFQRRCLKFEINPPKENWCGIWDMKEK